MLKFLVLIFCSSTSFAFISYQELAELPTHQKKAYLILIQKLSVQVEQSLLNTAQYNLRTPTWVAFLSPTEALANELAVDRVCKISSASNLSDTDLVDLVLQTMNCSEVVEKGQVSKFSQVVPERIQILETEINKRIKTSTNNTLRRGIRELEEVKQDVQSRGVRGGRTLLTSTSTISARPAPIASQPSSPQTAVAPAVQVTGSSAPTPAVTTTPMTTAPLDLNQVLCLYAGHIVTKKTESKCQAQTQIEPSDLNAFFNPEIFKCLPNQALCHPIAFGFISSCTAESALGCKDRKPLCVSKSKSASTSCLEQSQKFRGTENLIQLLDNSEIAASFDQYQNDLKMICDPQWIKKARLSKRGRKDIAETCDVTKQAIQGLLNRSKLKQNLNTRPGQK